MSGWTILRICGIILGTAALLRLATVGLGIEYKLYFQQFLEQLKGIIDLGFLVDPIEKFIVHPSLDWLRSLGLTIPPLQEHWRSAFVLLWLLHGSIARNSRGDGLVYFLFAIIWGGLTALAAGAMTGTVQLNSVAMIAWPLAGFVACMAGHFVWGVLHRDRPWLPLLFAAGAVAVAIGGHVATKQWPSLFDVPSPGLLVLAGVVGAVGLLFCLMGLYAASRRRWALDNSFNSIGLDILGVMGLALALGYIMAA